jgi:hypothetical protein
MRISTPVTSRARKQRVVIQWVTRTRTECREVSVVDGTAGAASSRAGMDPDVAMFFALRLASSEWLGEIVHLHKEAIGNWRKSEQPITEDRLEGTDEDQRRLPS